ncbi:10891_t:CDS:2 [Cetraspora pellucida]|uniref:10891_t:CDS:1 n=1 Tax=Cetraspora pellucida TaxID=1433469 RepID=A0ACA9LT57_9GLOM|nr:10891_t:CDS:2 [Cetraspora pellucida]
MITPPRTMIKNTYNTNTPKDFYYDFPTSSYSRSYDKPISHYYGYRDKVDHSLDSYMWYSIGDDDCSDNDYDP